MSQNTDKTKLSRIIESYMDKTAGLKQHCERCLRTERWGSNAVLMVVDAAFTSIGLNYFTGVVPKVMEFEKEFVNSGSISCFKGLKNLSLIEAEHIWKNKRSWNVARSVATYLDDLEQENHQNDRGALRMWAQNAPLENWQATPIGKVKGVGINTYQYLRMMGGVDTAMPDKIVRRVIREILEKAEVTMPTEDDIELVETIARIADISGYRSIEICWMTWLVQSEGDQTRMEKYAPILERI